MKPIIMSTEDVQAILTGCKTMARMAIKHQPNKSAIYMGISCGRARFETDTDMWNMMLPYNLGDVLWGRETWARFECAMGIGHIYRADDGADGELWYCRPDRWRSPVTMPRSAARLFLRVKDVRVERVQDITERDAIREGIMYTDFGMNEDMGELSVDGGKTFHELKPLHYPGYHAGGATNPDQCFCTARRAFADLWDARNAKRGYGWDSNPWVWVIEFERITQEEADE